MHYFFKAAMKWFIYQNKTLFVLYSSELLKNQTDNESSKPIYFSSIFKYLHSIYKSMVKV